jgi:hypothetical protein
VTEPGRPSFAKSLAVGRVGEARVAEVLAADGVAVSPTSRADQGRGDLRADGVLLEVKYDLYEARSGNVAVEFFNPRAGRPSGVASSGSDGWCFVLADRSAWVCPTPALRTHVEAGPAGAGFRRLSLAAGDGNASLALYDRRALFAALFRRLDGLPPGAARAELARLSYEAVAEAVDTPAGEAMIPHD